MTCHHGTAFLALEKIVVARTLISGGFLAALFYFDAGKSFCADVDIKNGKVVGREEYLFDKL